MRWSVVLAAAVWATAASAAPDRFEQAVLKEINRARAHPREVAGELRRYRANFHGLVAHENGDPVGTTTFEGAGAVDEAIAFLEAQAPLPPLDDGVILTRAARDWAETQGSAGAVGHGSGPGARVRAAGGDIYVGETISYGMPTPAAVARQFIIDDGQPRRGHRALLFSAGYRFAGVGCAAHARFGSLCVVDYAGTPDGAPILTQVAAVR